MPVATTGRQSMSAMIAGRWTKHGAGCGVEHGKRRAVQRSGLARFLKFSARSIAPWEFVTPCRPSPTGGLASPMYILRASGNRFEGIDWPELKSVMLEAASACGEATLGLPGRLHPLDLWSGPTARAPLRTFDACERSEL